MSLDAWRAFLEVCRLGSLSAAADELGYTQSAISRQVAGLERSVGVSLLERRARGVVPTSAGEAFRHHARIVVNEAHRARHAAREAQASTTHLTLGATPSTAAGIVPTALRAVCDHHPDLQWTLVTGLTTELEPQLLTGDVHVAIVTDAPPGFSATSRLTRELIGMDEMCVIVPLDHRLARMRDRISLEMLAHERWVEDNEGSAALLRTAASRAGFEPRTEITAADLFGKAAMVASGHAVGIVPGVLLDGLRSDLAALHLKDAPTRGIYLSRPADQTTSTELKTLKAALKNAFRSRRT